MSAGIDPAVLAFVDRHICSIEQLEILLLVHRQRNRDWSARAVSDELRSNPESAAARLAELAEDGLVAATNAGSPPTYRYHATGDADRTVAALADAYRDYRLRITERVFSKPDGLSSFADAFRLRRKGE
jgi:predicted ArsR family transcriptional regulator